MNTNMNVTIRHLTTTFILLFLVLSGVAAYVQIGNAAPFNGPALAGGPYETRQRQCPPVDKPLRGRILDRNGNVIAETVPDPSYICGYKRVYSQWAIDTGLAPLIGYSTYNRGSSGVEATYDDYLSGQKSLIGLNPNNVVQAIANARNKLVHQPQYGSDLYLTVDMNAQVSANKYYTSSVITGGNSCPPTQSDSGSVIVEDPKTGEILAMVSKAAPNNPNLDLNAIEKTDSLDSTVRAEGEAYFSALLNDPGTRLLNRASQGQYAPGSTFKTVTLAAALDTGKYALNDARFSENDSRYYTVNGEHINWDDYNISHVFQGVAKFPLDLEHAYAYSDNTVFARAAVDLGTDTWLHYAGLFGIQTPGRQWNQFGFDAPYAQSRAYPATQNGKDFNYSVNALAESGFGQGPLLISPLTMSVVASTVASDGVLRAPHIGLALAAYDPNDKSKPDPNKGTAVPHAGDQQILQSGTAQNVRKAMWAVTSYGTGLIYDPVFGGNVQSSGTFMGGKTGTAQIADGIRPGAWWVSLAPDDQAPGAPGGAQYVIVVNKEPVAGAGSNEGACQVFVANDIYRTILKH